MNPGNSKFQELAIARELPTSRGVARHVLKIVQKEEPSAEELAHIVQADPALAARVVKAANAESGADARPVIGIRDALAMLGIRRVRQLALGFSVLPADANPVCANFDLDAYWRQSLATGIAFSAIAKTIQTLAPEEAFVLGLLSRVGSFALATIHPREYDAVLADWKAHPDTALVALEREAFATDHNELCAGLMCEWGIPRAVAEAVRYHEAPEHSDFARDSRTFTAARALGFARALAEADATDRGEALRHDEALLVLARELGIDTRVYGALLSDVADEWHRYREFLVATDTSVSGGEPETEAEGADTQNTTSRLRLLVVDDDPVILEYVGRMLAAAGHEVFTAPNGQRALELALDKNPQVIITDWVMPEMDGVSLCHALRQTRLGRNIYIMVTTDSSDSNRLVEAFEAGADDFVRKPVTPKVLRARLRAAERVLQLHADFEHDREEMRRVSTGLAIENRRYEQTGLVDALTGLPNRHYAMQLLEQEHSAAKRARDPFACLVVEPYEFDRVNDTYGAGAGDALLKGIALALRETARAHDVVSRFDGQKFLVVCPNTGVKGAQACAERLRARANALQIASGAQTFSVTVSIGASVWNKSMLSPDALLQGALVALHRAREGGRSRVAFPLMLPHQPVKRLEAPAVAPRLPLAVSEQ